MPIRTADTPAQLLRPADETPSPSAEHDRWPAFPGALQLELVTATPRPGQAYADLADPFVPLGRHGRFSRTLLARVAGPGGETIRELALKVQSDEYPITELPGWSNCDVDEQWCRQWRVWTMAAEAGAAPQVLDVLPTAADGGAPLLPPTLYCKQRHAFFVAPCPECAAPLQTCRDNRVLEEQGLPRYDQSLERFLYCPACHAAGHGMFYALFLSDPRLRTHRPVGEQTDLYRALGPLARRGGPLPCAGCAQTSSCYPLDTASAGDATRFLTPLSFYDFRCLPLERLHLHYDEFAGVLAGRSTSEIGGPPAPALPDSGGRRYLFEDDPRGKLALEILRLKLMLFGQLAATVSALHRVTRLPHLALSPENIMVDCGSVSSGLPSFYAFRTQLLGIGSASPSRFQDLATDGLTFPLLEPPPLRDATYAAPSFTAGSQPVQVGSLTITGLAPADNGRVVLQADLASDAFDVRTLRPKDTLQIMVRQGRPLPLAFEFLANPAQADGTRVPVRSIPTALESGLVAQLRSLLDQPPVRATFAIFPCLHVPYDVQSLGLLLFTTLLVSAEQSPAVVTAEARKISARVALYASDHAPARTEDIFAFASEQLRAAEADGILAARHLFYRPATATAATQPVPETFWEEALLLGLRALTQVAGFGFCRERDDFDPEHPEGPVDHLRAELDVLTHNIDAELLGMRGKRGEIADAIAQVQQGMSSSAYSKAG